MRQFLKEVFATVMTFGPGFIAAVVSAFKRDDIDNQDGEGG